MEEETGSILYNITGTLRELRIREAQRAALEAFMLFRDLVASGMTTAWKSGGKC